MKPNNIFLAISFAVILGVTPSIASAADSVFIPEQLFTHQQSQVGADGELLTSSIEAPMYRQLKGLLPKGWELVFTEHKQAIAPIQWKKGALWVDVLDKWGSEGNFNVMLDGYRKKVVVSREQNKMPRGVLFVHSNNVLHQEMFRPEARYEAAQAYVHKRLKELVGTYRDELAFADAQAQLHDVERLHSELQSQEALIANNSNAVEATNIEPPYEMSGDMQIFNDGKVTYPMQKGFLKSQIINMLIDSGRVASVDDVVWDVSENHLWPNDYLASAPSFDHLIGKILATYRMAVIYQANNIVVIRYIERGK